MTKRRDRSDESSLQLMTNEQCSNHNSDNKKTRVDSNYAQIEGIQKNIIFSMATYSPEVTLVRSTVVKGAPEITPGDRVTHDIYI